jgi:menaquinone-dependent protoporphyrinogen IX oxidase
MLKVFVVYDTKYGNTKLVAEKIIEGLKEAKEIETAISYVKDVPLQKLAEYDALVIGAPNHMGKPSRTITKFIDKLPQLSLKARWIAVFDTYFARQKNFAKAVRKMEKQVSEKLPNLKLTTPGLSIMVTGIRGPIAAGELPKCVAFGKSLANQMK